MDSTTGGGYGVLYGPGVDASGHPTGGQGLIAGDETLAYAAENGASTQITLMVQVPDSYNPGQGCIVTAPSSGSRGIYGAIASAGDWGLKHGCAVAYTDKGTGTGFDDLQNGLVDTLRGDVTTIAAAGANAQFVAPLSPQERAQYNAAFPDRFAFKHAFSRQNPERDWGTDVLQSIQFAFYVLNQKFPGANISKRNTIVIASSVSNGGGASLRAIEQDHEGLIDGAAVSEPNVNPKNFRPFTIAQAGSPPFTAQPTESIDYVTFQNIYEGCARQPDHAPFNLAPSAARCAALHADGLLASTTPDAQAAEAQQKLNAFGFLPEQNFTEPLLWFAYVPQAIVVTYANAYGRFKPTDNLCGISFAATDPTSNAWSRCRRPPRRCCSALATAFRRRRRGRRRPRSASASSTTAPGPRTGRPPPTRIWPPRSASAGWRPGSIRSRVGRWRPPTSRRMFATATGKRSRPAICMGCRRSSSRAAPTTSCRRTSSTAPMSG